MSVRRTRRVPKPLGAFELPTVLRPWTRFELLVAVAQQPACTSELAIRHGLDDSVVCKHLKYLERAGLLEQKAEGRRRVYRRSPRAGVQWLDDDVVVTLRSRDRAMLVYQLPEEVVARLQSVLVRPSANGEPAAIAGAIRRGAWERDVVRVRAGNAPRASRRATGP